MTATPLTPELQDELDGLRRRAYGASADIWGDVDAVARLHALEARARTTVTAPPTPRASPDHPARDAAMFATSDDVGPLAEPSTGPALTADDAGSLVESPTDPAVLDGNSTPADTAATDAAASVPLERRRTWWRRPRLIALGAGVLVAGLLGGYLLAGTVGPRPDTVLARMDVADATGSSLEPDSYLEYLGLPAADLEPYEQFHDVTVWGGNTSSGSRCLLIVGDRAGILWAACAPAGLDPVVDLPVRSQRFLEDLELGTGGAVRFVERNGTVEVFIGRGASSS